MKAKKLLSVILSACLLISAAAFGALSASAKPVLMGEWEFSDIAANNITAEEQERFDKAVEGIRGVGYEAKDVIAVQSAAKYNFAYLCIATPATLDGTPYWAVVTVREDLDDNISINCIKKIDPADVKVTDTAPEIAPGSWGCSVNGNAAPLPENVKNAIDTLEGVSYSAIAVLGTQTVSGTNYSILAYGTLVTEIPETRLYSIKVYEDLDGNAEVKSISILDLDAYVSSEPVVEPVEESSQTEQFDGGWSFSALSADNMNAEEQAVFDKAVEGIRGVSYEAKDKLATQSSVKYDHAFLCIATPATLDGTPYWTVVTVREDLKDNISLCGIKAIDPADVKVTENVPEIAPGSWIAATGESTAPLALPEGVQAAIDSFTGVSYSPIAVLGTQVVAGTNYRILAYGTLVTEYPVTHLYVIDIYEDLAGNAEITSVAPFDLSAYISEKSTDESSVESSEEESSKEESSKESTVTPSIPDVPKTGSSDSIAITVILMLLAGGAVTTAFAARKKQR